MHGRLRDWVAYAERRFSAARLAFGHGAHTARDEAVWLLVHVLKAAFDDVGHLAGRTLDAREERAAFALIERRIATRKPLAYLLREAWLAGQHFYVDERVIVPRSFIAELLPEALRAWLGQRPVTQVLDLCTGSGCLCVLAARAFPAAHVVASDISAGALAVARRNAAEHKLASRIRLVRGDLLENVPRRRFQLILSNPPYVRTASMRRLPREYRAEPRRALAGGPDGLDFVMRILRAAPGLLAPQGVLVVEIGRNRTALERRAPHTPFVWLTTSAGDDMVFLVTREGLLESPAESRTATSARPRRAAGRVPAAMPRRGNGPRSSGAPQKR